MSHDETSPWTDRSTLLKVQYRTDTLLAARQGLYRYQHPRLDLPALVLGRAGLAGPETVADIGCGNGAYLAELARCGHAGPVFGVDLSYGMLRATRARVPSAVLAAGDAAALPLKDAAATVTIAAHMLYHVPDPAAAIRELRRVTRPGGRVLVVLNGLGHLRELRELIAAAGAGPAVTPRRHLLPDPAAVARAVAAQVPAGPGPFVVTAHTGLLICS